MRACVLDVTDRNKILRIGILDRERITKESESQIKWRKIGESK